MLGGARAGPPALKLHRPACCFPVRMHRTRCAAKTGDRGWAKHDLHDAGPRRRMTTILLVPPLPAPSIPAYSFHHCRRRPLLRPVLSPPLRVPLLLLPCVGSFPAHPCLAVVASRRSSVPEGPSCGDGGKMAARPRAPRRLLTDRG
jgi:hypothetical protein